MLTLTEFDMADYLSTEALRCEYLEDVKRDGDKEEMRRARSTVERARNMERYTSTPMHSADMETYNTLIPVAF